MKLLKISCAMIVLLSAFGSCKKDNFKSAAESSQLLSKKLTAQTVITETFETGTKTAYTDATVTLSTGVWDFNDALLGNSSSDAKDGNQSARVRNSGILTTDFDYSGGASTVTVKHGLYGSDASGTWQLWYSTNGGSTYTETGSTITTSSKTLATASFTLNVSGNIRFQIRKTDGGSNRINFDDFAVTSYGGITNTPTLTSLSPDTATAGGAAFTITATGTYFVSGATINWNGTALATTFVSATSLTASVPATDIATAGTASVTVTASGTTTSAVSFIIKGTTTGQKKYLFDALHEETAGNADWVIDEDNSTPQRIPTPAQSGITASTPETYWTGALSSFGIDLVKAGEYVETLPATGAITYGNASNPQDLSNYSVFVVDEPNTPFTATEKTAILNFVKNGGGLFMVSDHDGASRLNNGWEAVTVWNDLMQNNTIQKNPFGFSIDSTNISQTSTNVLTNKTSNKILNGSQGAVSEIEFDNGATLTLEPTANNTVQGLVWETGDAQGNTHVMTASSTYGTGRVYVITDSSPLDDGTGASGNELYVGWSLYSHTQLFMNAALWLAKLQ